MFTPAQRLQKVRKSAIRRLYDEAPTGSINLGLGEPDFQTPEVVRHEALRVIEEESTGYTANAGIGELRARVASYHREGNYQPIASSVCITNGAQEALFATVMALAGPGDEVMVPNPGFLAYPAIAELAGATIVEYALPRSRRFGFDADAFANALSSKTRVVLVVSPSNPTGRVLSADDLSTMAELLAGSDAWVISDEIYRDIYYEVRPASISLFRERTIVVSGLSKMMSMTGWRIGWAVGPEEVIRQVTVMHQYVSTCASTVSQKAGLAAFSDQGRHETALMREELGRRRTVMMRAIERELNLRYIAGEGAFYVMLDVSGFGSSDDIARRLLGNRVITIPGSAFGSEGEGHLRLSFSIKPELIEEGIRRIAEALRNNTE